MAITFKRAEKINDKPERVEKALNGWYIRKSFKSEAVVDLQNEEIKNIKYSYDEAFLTDDEYNIFLIGQEISGENYNSDAYLNYKAALDKPVIYPENGNKYKPLWVKNAQGEDGVYIDFLQKGEMFPELIYPIAIWDATENPEKIVAWIKRLLRLLLVILVKFKKNYIPSIKLPKGKKNRSVIYENT